MFEPDRVAKTRSFDGTTIAYQEFGEGPTLLVGNGIGVGYPGLSLQIEHLRKRFRVVTWDHRGIYSSAEPGPGGVSMQAQAGDGLAVLDAVGAERAAYLGWSMGVQVGFEAWRTRPGCFSRIAAIGGVAASPFRSAMPIRGLERLVPPLLDGLARLSPWYAPLLFRLVASDSFFRAACLARYLRPSANREVFMAMARGVASHDAELYLRTLAELGRHDAEGVLGGLPIPVLFLAGGQDHLTPRHELERLAALVAAGRAYTVEDASHFVTIEAPDEVNRVLEDFFCAP